MLALGSDLVNDSLKYVKLLTQNKKEIAAVNPAEPFSSLLVLHRLRAVQLIAAHSYFQLFCHRIEANTNCVACQNNTICPKATVCSREIPCDFNGF